MDWIGSSTAAVITVAPGAVNAQYLVLPSEVQEQFTDPTLVRTRGDLIVTSALFASGFMRAAVGIIPWDDSNDTPPVSPETPSPLSSTSMDWIWHDWIFQPVSTGNLSYQASIGSAGGTAVDSKAMRRLGGRRGILLVLENASTSINSITAMYGFRCLLKD